MAGTWLVLLIVLLLPLGASGVGYVTQSVYGATAYADGYYFNVVRSLPVISGHGGYSDYGPLIFNPHWTFLVGRMRDLPALVAGLEREWQLDVGPPIGGVLVMRPNAIRYNERLPLVVWLERNAVKRRPTERRSTKRRSAERRRSL